MNLSKSKYEEAFAETLARLNPAQKQAVESIEGPVLVIAGPGTGKTQILAARIGKILQETDTPPNSILCLTYTDTGRIEMRNRLFKLIGPAAYRVNIHTFHSFCNEVIQDNLYYFGKQNLEAISELEEIELFQKLLDTLSIDSPLKKFKSDISYETYRVKNLFSLIKKEAWSVEFLNKKIDEYLASLSTRDEFIYKRNSKDYKAGDLKLEAIKKETEDMEKLRAAVNLFPTYEKMMHDMARYTFDDMILWVLKAFEKDKVILLNYQEKYLYFLVDEFQDTSGSQNILLKQLIDYWDSPNVFVVGDDDQSIYSFQDANVENIKHFADRYSNTLKKIVLVDNYRSTQPILDIAKSLIEHNKERIVNSDLSLDKNLKAVNPLIKDFKLAPRIVEFANTANEITSITKEIEVLINEGISPSEIAVLYRTHRQAEDLVTYLEKKKIPVNMRRNVNILELPFIKKVLNILSYIVFENDTPSGGDEKLFQVLHYDFFNIAPLEVARLTIEVSQRNIGNRKDRYSLRRLISEQATGTVSDLFTQSEVNEVRRVSDILEGLIKRVNNVTLQELFEEVVREAGILNYIVKSPDKPWLMEVLTVLFNFIKSETRKDPSLTLHRLLQMIDIMERHNIRIPLTKVSSNEQGVNLMTAHGSKGTEYEYVFLMGCVKNVWDEKNASATRTFKFPDNISDNKYLVDELEESRRLFYVALTRAKTHLQISYSVKDGTNRLLERSSFVSEIMSDSNIEEEKREMEESTLTEYLELQYMANVAPEVKLIDKNYIDKILETYSLSVTHLNNYLECPIKFYYQNLIRVPAAKSESMAFGSVIHLTLQALFEKMKADNDFPDKEEMLDDFARYMARNREAFTKEQFNRRMEYGQKILPAYYDFYLNKWNKIVLLETSIRNVEINGVPINGKLDKLEFDGKKINVVDYKTGKYENAKKKLKYPQQNEPLGGDYWRQAVFYKILLDNFRSDWQAVSTEFDFIEPVKNEYKTEKIVVTPEDIAIVTEQIMNTWEKIQKHEFTKGCGKEDCHWCNFVKDNNLHVPLHELADEE
jgi:DNA helicase-2/ATP-dependent DNA helicase PcrA